HTFRSSARTAEPSSTVKASSVKIRQGLLMMIRMAASVFLVRARERCFHEGGDRASALVFSGKSGHLQSERQVLFAQQRQRDCRHAKEREWHCKHWIAGRANADRRRRWRRQRDASVAVCSKAIIKRANAGALGNVG